MWNGFAEERVHVGVDVRDNHGSNNKPQEAGGTGNVHTDHHLIIDRVLVPECLVHHDAPSDDG